jgi:hypothetical protein
VSKHKIQLVPVDVARIRHLYAEVQTALNEVATIEWRAAAKQDAAFARRTKGKAVIGVRTGAGHHGAKAAVAPKSDEGVVVVTLGPLCVSFGSGPNMALCYDDENGVCYLDDGFGDDGNVEYSC